MLRSFHTSSPDYIVHYKWPLSGIILCLAVAIASDCIVHYESQVLCIQYCVKQLLAVIHHLSTMLPVGFMGVCIYATILGVSSVARSNEEGGIVL